MGTSAGSGGTGGTGGTGGGSAVPAGAGGAATPAGTGGTGGSTSGSTGGTTGGTGGGVPVSGEQISKSGAGSQMKSHTERVSGRRSDAGDPDNPEADQFIADAKRERKERMDKARSDALAESEDEAEDEGTPSARSGQVSKGQQGSAASGGRRQAQKRAKDVTGEDDEAVQ